MITPEGDLVLDGIGQVDQYDSVKRYEPEGVMTINRVISFHSVNLNVGYNSPQVELEGKTFITTRFITTRTRINILYYFGRPKVEVFRDLPAKWKKHVLMGGLIGHHLDQLDKFWNGKDAVEVDWTNEMVLEFCHSVYRRGK